MRSLTLASFIAVFVSILALAQSGHAPLVNQPNTSFLVQSQRSGAITIASRPLQGVNFARGRNRTDASRRAVRPAQDLSFAPAVPYNSGGYEGYSVAVADVNKDGKPDLVVANANDSVGVLFGNGDGTFQPVVTYGFGVPVAVAVTDVNGDGNPDIVVADFQAGSNYEGGVGVLLGNGNGTFQTETVYDSGGSDALSIAVGDVNGDGKPDLVVANAHVTDNDNGNVGVLINNGDGTFQTVITYPSEGYSGSDKEGLALADVNGDGILDLIVANNCSDSFCQSDGVVAVLLGNRDGTFQTAAIYDSGGHTATSLAVADVNGDGKPDLLVANEAGTVAVLLGNGDGTFQAAVTYGAGGSPDSIAVADLNGDGKSDLVASNYENNSAGVLLGNGDGTFQAAVTYGSGGYIPQSVAVADVNGDSKPDLLVANYSATSNLETNGTVGVLINTSLGATQTTLESSSNPSQFGQAVTFTATVISLGFSGTPTGSVSFFDGGTSIGNSNLNSNGVATLMTSALAVGTHTITATYNGDSNFAPSTSPPLYQVVQGAIAMLSPSGLNFGNQTVGLPSAPQNVTLTNTGNINLLISMIQITGANMNDFSQNNNCPASLAPNASCKISVTFTPTTTGTRNAAVSVSDNAPNSPQSASLTGVGVLPAVMFSPSSLTFPVTVVYTKSAPKQLTLTNTGLGILEIKGATISAQFAIKTDCSKTLATGASCTAEVRFKPTTKGPISGSIILTDNAPDSPQQVPLSGTGTFVSLSPTSLNFGNQPVNTTSPPKYITLSNKGTGVVNFTGSGITLTGADPGDFAEQNNCGNSVPSGGYCRIKVTFTPTQQGKRTADVSVSDDGGGSPQLVPLSGTGTP